MSEHLRRFGPYWDPALDEPGDPSVMMPAPIGKKCLYCQEMIVAGDSGQEVGVLEDAGTGYVGYAHVECLALNTSGHLVGICGCTGYAGLDQRAAGIEALGRLRRGEFVT